MGNLRQKYTDEEWEDILKNGYSSIEHLTVEEAIEKYGVDINDYKMCENEPLNAKCVPLTDRDISEMELISQQIKNNGSWEIDLNNPISNLVKALQKDKDYYESWKANIAMAFKDEYVEQSYKVDNARLEGFLTEIDIHELSNNAAERFLKQLMSWKTGATYEKQAQNKQKHEKWLNYWFFFFP